MNTERDKFLTEAMGGCWHSKSRERCQPYCPDCGATWMQLGVDFTNDFSTWEGFGKLWEWAQRQEWWEEFVDADMADKGHKNWLFPIGRIHPDRLAESIYKFLKER